LRIDEALGLQTSKIDFENMLITVAGKGSKERVVPMSFELRKVLLKFGKMHNSIWFFPTRAGARIKYHNTLRRFKCLCKTLGITGVRCSFHTLRHTFAYKYAQAFAQATGNAENGILHLQKQLGHTSLMMTRRYVELQPEDLKAAHARISIMTRLR
jgi:integrase/recombinase XerD